MTWHELVIFKFLIKFYFHFMQTEYLFKNCYLLRHDFERKQVSDKNLRVAIRNLQKVHNTANQRGFTDSETCKVIRETSIDPLPMHQLRRRIRRWALNGHKFPKTNLTYWLVSIIFYFFFSYAWNYIGQFLEP